ncbi:glycosyl transferase [Bacillus weihaiensis]|uniref:glycosyl transferase n=1 Tax=Bacillus weihaiensis TaxID=1547283 RepID=UPI002352D867|nr:glycosyl transferase [Bacillus weihaiensis]
MTENRSIKPIELLNYLFGNSDDEKTSSKDASDEYELNERKPIDLQNNHDEKGSEKANSKKNDQLMTQESSLAAAKGSSYNFCVISGKEYMFKVLTLYNSLMKHEKNFHFYLCCIDEVTYSLFEELSLRKMTLVRVEYLEDIRLKRVKKLRQTNEYCWTLKAPLMEYLLEKYELPSILYLDGDLFFFSNPKVIFKEWGEKSIYLCPQRDVDWVEEKYGKFQAGLIGFKNDQYGRNALTWWKEQCIDWCYKKSSNNRFGDQKYLDDLARFFPKVCISSHLGIDAAPWNIIYNNNYKLTSKGKRLFIEEDELIVFHFACFSIYNFSEFDLWSLSTLTIQREIINYVYAPYMEAVRGSIEKISQTDKKVLELGLHKSSPTKAKTYYKYSKLSREIDQWDHYMNFAVIMSKDYLLKGLALYESIYQKMKNFHMWILTMDKPTYSLLREMNLTNVSLIQLEELEDDRLLSVKKERTLNEYCWTLKAPLCEYILTKTKEIDHIIYCDSDMYFFNSPLTLLKEWKYYSIFLTKQNGTAELERVHGQYQAGLIGFKRDEMASMILDWWKEKCLDQCSNDYHAQYDSWGDQKYLESIPKLFSNIKIIDNIGMNVAPWNVVMRKDHIISNKKDNVYIDENVIVSYHFGSLLIIDEESFDLWKLEELPFSKEVIEYIYLPYIDHLKTICKRIKGLTSFQAITPFLSSDTINYTAKNPLVLNDLNRSTSS